VLFAIAIQQKPAGSDESGEDGEGGKGEDEDEAAHVGEGGKDGRRGEGGVQAEHAQSKGDKSTEGYGDGGIHEVGEPDDKGQENGIVPEKVVEDKGDGGQ
jgi:hypothetical protein